MFRWRALAQTNPATLPRDRIECAKSLVVLVWLGPVFGNAREFLNDFAGGSLWPGSAIGSTNRPTDRERESAVNLVVTLFGVFPTPGMDLVYYGRNLVGELSSGGVGQHSSSASAMHIYVCVCGCVFCMHMPCGFSYIDRSISQHKSGSDDDRR